MHASLYVLIPKGEAADSEEARQEADSYLNDSGFCAEGSRFGGGGVADWFVIGGRWSGTLEEERMKVRYGETVVKAYWEEHDKLELNWSTKDAKEKKANAIRNERLMAKHFPGWKGIPLGEDRDTFASLGSDFDAQLVDKELLPFLRGAFKQGDDYYSGGCVVFRDEGESEPTNLNALVGKYWIVVVDFHN